LEKLWTGAKQISVSSFCGKCCAFVNILVRVIGKNGDFDFEYVFKKMAIFSAEKYEKSQQ
jgi:hypothetical protein